MKFSSQNFSVYILDEPPVDPRVGLIFKGTFQSEHYDNNSTNWMNFYLTVEDNVSGDVKQITEIFAFPCVLISQMDTEKEIKRTKTIPLDYEYYESLQTNRSSLKLNLITNFNASLPVNFAYDPSPLDKDMGIIYATIVLLGLYVMVRLDKTLGITQAHEFLSLVTDHLGAGASNFRRHHRLNDVNW
jgi:P protein